MKRLLLSCIVAPLLACLGVAATPAAGPASGSRPRPLQLQGLTMGTTWRALVPSSPSDYSRKSLQSAIQRSLDEMEERWSHYRPASEISRFNRHRSTQWFSVAPETARLVQLALEISEQTDGAFDITVGSLTTLWGFGPGRLDHTPPTSRQIAQAGASSGFRRIEVRLQEHDQPSQSPALRKAVPELQIDLSGIAKGWAVDHLGEVLQERGARDFLVDVGGEIKVRGRNRERQPWSIALERSSKKSGRAMALYRIRDQAIATSGIKTNRRPGKDGHVHHILDPRTGFPTSGEVIQVSVLHASAAQADALATAMIVMGSKQAAQFARKHKIKALLVTEENGGEKWLRLGGFPEPRR